MQDASASAPRASEGHTRALTLTLILASACAAPPDIYTPLQPVFVERQQSIPDERPQLEVGQPSILVDGLNHYVLSLPVKILLLNVQLLDHKLPATHREILDRYLRMNGMTAVKIRHNQYAPLAEFTRLWRNHEVGLFYRATVGMIVWLNYTIFPDRLLAGLPFSVATPIGNFGPVGDHFNPFSNTIHVYSSDLGVLLHEAGHAKEYAQQSSKGTWSLLRALPGIDLFQEAYASSDAIRFLSCIEQERAELRAYTSLIPAYSTYLTGYSGGGLLIGLPIVATGHVVAWIQRILRGRALDRRAEGLDALADSRRLFQPPACKEFAAPLVQESPTRH